MMKLQGKIFHICFLSIFLLILFLNTNVFAKIYDTNYFHIEKITNNVTLTKINEIEKVKLKSLYNIIDRILTSENKNLFYKNFKHKNDLDRLIQNILIEKELITKNKYVADVKVNFDQKELIKLLRIYKINYTDLPNEPFLILSTYNFKFNYYGLSSQNPFYSSINLKLLNEYNNYINFIIPDLSANDRFIASYANLKKNNVSVFSKLSNKYKTKNILHVEITKKSKEYFFSIYFYSFSNQKFESIINYSFNNFDKLNDEFFIKINDWWKNYNAIKNKVDNKLNCKILSKNYADLINIKNIISNLSQFKSIKILSINLDENIEEISFYGDFDIFKKSLFLNNIMINLDNQCTIKSI